MLKVTFLGHQGWAISSNQTTILIDPLFHEGIGDSNEDYYLRLYPPRTFNFASMPPIQAVIISHEHPDHLHLPSLVLLDRKIPIYLSSLSSFAARRVLQEMGFTVKLLAPADHIQIESLEVITLHPDGRTRADELDVVPFIVHETGNKQNNFFTTIDLSPTLPIIQELKTHIPKIGIWAVANNDLDVSLFYSWHPFTQDQSAERASSWKEQYKQFFQNWTPPTLTAVYGGGFSFEGSLSWLNENVFNCDQNDVVKHFRKLVPEAKIHPSLPGETFVLQSGQWTETLPSTDYLRAQSIEQWPKHQAKKPNSEEIKKFFPPGCGRTDITTKEEQELTEQLQRFAQFLFNSSLFYTLYRIGPNDCKNTRPTVAFLLRTNANNQKTVWAYDPQASAFKRDTAAEQTQDPTAAYLAGVECWATDLLALFKFERTAGYTLFGHMRFWNSMAQQWNIELDTALYLYTHPLCQPDRYYTVYHRQAEAIAHVKPQVWFSKE